MSLDSQTKKPGLSGLFTATALFRGSQNMALTTIALLFKEHLGMGATAIGAVAALAAAAMVVTTLFVSARLRPHQLEGSVALSLLLLTTGLILFAVANSILVAAVAALILGVASGLGLPGLTGSVQRAAVLRGTGTERSLAVFTLVLSASLAVAPLIESVILDLFHQNVRAPFAIFTIFPLLALVLVLVRGHRHPEARLAPAQSAPSTSPRQRPFSVPEVRRALFAQLMYAVPFAGLSIFGVTLARVSLGATPAQAQLAFTGFFAVSFFSRALVALRAPIHHKGMVIVASGGLTIIGLILIGTGHTFGYFVLAMAILGVPHGAIFPIALALMTERLKPAALPKANSLLIGASNIVGIAVPATLGKVAEVIGYQPMVLTMLIPVTGLLGWIILQLLRSHSAIEPVP
ncbi:MAG: MFS transporter [Ferrimicrobium sp.]